MKNNTARENDTGSVLYLSLTVLHPTVPVQIVIRSNAMQFLPFPVAVKEYFSLHYICYIKVQVYGTIQILGISR
jgi:hypothetical protein